MAYGSTPDTWSHFSNVLGLTADMLPVVSNPGVPISEKSTMTTLGKTPSVYNYSRHVVGLSKWTEKQSTADEVARWSRESDYGICVQARTVRAIDIDIDALPVSREIVALVEQQLGVRLPLRYRENTGKALLTFRTPVGVEWPKRVIHTASGAIEFLGDGQQFIADGTHPSGGRYLWRGGLPDAIPVIGLDDIERVWGTLVALYAVGDAKISRSRLSRSDVVLDVPDERGEWLLDNWEVYDTGRVGELFLQCPFEDEHTTDSGPTATAYLPRGTGGFERGHWKCLHAHCDGREDDDFDERCGYRTSGLSSLPVPAQEDQPAAPVDREWPAFTRDKQGKIEATRRNLFAFLSREDVSGMWIAYDDFLDQIVWAPASQPDGEQQWQFFSDEHYIDIAMSAEKRGFKPFATETLRLSILHSAKKNVMDSAQVWLGRLVWDGVPRVDTFLASYFGTEDTAYTRAVSRYMWSAQAGRVISPGAQADMAPVFVGAQGLRKTTAIKALAPADDFYVEINLTSRDDDLSRKLRGKLVAELEELRGLNTKENDEIKAWITRTHEQWVPKYREFSAKFARRIVLYGSTNVAKILADVTGERRWLPVMVGTVGGLNPEGIAAARDQLWAEGAAIYGKQGIDWSDAERLAKAEHSQFKVGDVWSAPVNRWLDDKGLGQHLSPRVAGFCTMDALSGIGVAVSQASRATELRMERVLVGLGLVEGKDGKWRPTGDDHLPSFLR